MALALPWRMLDRFINDIRFGLRTLAKNRGFAAVAIVTLGLGIGANTAIFSVIYGVLLKPLPYAEGDRLVLLRQSAPLIGRDDVSVSIKEFYTYRNEAADFDGLVEYHQMNFDLLRRGDPDRVSTGVVSANFFDVLGIAPIVGRTFVADDDKPGAPAVLMLSYSYWQRKFGGDRNIVGQVFEMNDRPHTVIGVLPNVPHYPQENDVYMPSSACPFRAAGEKRMNANARSFAALNVFGRLKPGVTRERAAADVDVICRRFAADDKTAYRPSSGFTSTALGVREEMTRNARPLLLILLGSTGLILLIACANVANLTLARLLRRDRELGVRAALGASRARLVGQLLTESALLSFAGGAFGLLFASWTVGLLTTFVQRFTPRAGEVAIDVRVLLFTAAISLVTALVFGTLPATASRVDLAGAMKQGGKGATGGRHGIQSALVVVQVAVSVVLLVGAGLLLTSFYRLQRVDAGYSADRVMTAELFTTNFTRYPNAEAQRRFYLPLLERLGSQPGVLSAAITNAVPLRTSQPFTGAFQIEGRVVDDPNKRPTADARVVSSDFFKTLGVRLMRGRTFTEADDQATQHVVVINTAMTRYWDGSDPVGARISFDNGETWATVVGVVGDIKQFGLDKPAVAQVYTPLRQTTQGLGGLLLLRTISDAAAAKTLIRDAVWAIDPDMPIVRVRTLDEIRDQYLATPKLTAILLTVFAALALLVTVAGITGVIATTVSERTQEFGIRMALGASRRTVLRMVVGEGLLLVAAGLLVGGAAASAASRVLASYLFDTTPTDPVAFVAVVVAFLIAGAAACLGPAWRATTVDPIAALRAE